MYFKKIMLLVLLLFINTASTNERTPSPPDYTVITEAITDEQSDFYYDGLMARLKSFDLTLTNDEFIYLYYGYTLQDTYQPYVTFKKANELNKYLQEGMLAAEYDHVEALAYEALDHFPFDAVALRLLIRLHTTKKNIEEERKVAHIYQQLILTIIRSGSGISCKEAFHVISVPHEYLILNTLRLLPIKQQSLIGECDYLEFADDLPNKPRHQGKPLNGYYFNVSRLLNSFSPEQIDKMLENDTKE